MIVIDGLVLHGGAGEIASRENFLQDLEPLPGFGGMVEVNCSNFNWRRHGRGGGEVWYRSDILYISHNVYHVLGVWYR